MAQMSQVQELFHEAAQQEALAQPQPWWKIQLFIWEPVLFGTWDGRSSVHLCGKKKIRAMYIAGFAESISDPLSLGSPWAVRGISVAVLLSLLGTNPAGVNWVIRLRLPPSLLLAASTLDFVVGRFTHLDPGKPFGVQ
ncbi:solute carrier family 12 member 8-like [Physeter macrocephalus]|uniref:Solute carrier family 12 member 8-like n=1 Tax=Physeter macrocephalus TaxID=9755 RepID=A0A455BIB4_PHYMC|nr:solute carrier family 12 member 8-like [Physeter catodon]|eukprot:XP_028348710.1 solute carrier family 12 member 8-like [Physeter catodon]